MKNIFKTGLIGIITGFVNGLFGSGGGTIVVPAMQKFLDVDTVKSHATAIAIILPLSIVSGFLYLKSSDIEWLPVLFVSIGGLVGGLIGSNLLSKVSNNMLHKIFGLFIIISAVRMII